MVLHKPLFNGSPKPQKRTSTVVENEALSPVNTRKQKRPRIRRAPPSKEKEKTEATPQPPRKHSSQWKLDLSIMLRLPSLNYKLWDESEIMPLEAYREQFHSIRKEYEGNSNFFDNWVNCDKAVKYFYSDIAPKWTVADKTIPLKEAIRTGKAVRTDKSLLRDSPETVKNILQLHRDGELFETIPDSPIEQVSQLLQEKQNVPATITVSEYLHVKQNSNDTKLKDLLNKYKHNPDRLQIVDQRTNPFQSTQFFDPKSDEHMASCVPSPRGTQFLIDKRLEREDPSLPRSSLIS